MNRFEELIKSVSAMPSVIVHLGAGTCGECESYKSKDADRVIYVEPNQYLAETATETFSDTSHVKVIPHAIAAENGPQTLNITNNWRFSSLLLPGKLLDFYPNIEVNEQTEVEAITLTQLCQDEEISEDSDNLLIAELQGLEKEIFSSTKVETLQRFKWIIIRSSETCLYAPASDNAQRSLLEVMQDADFMVMAFEEDAPPFIDILCIRNNAALINRLLKTRLTESQLSFKSESAELEESRKLAQSITAKKNTQQQQITELSNSVDIKSAELEESRKLVQSITTEKEAQQQQIIELTDALNKKSSENSEIQQTLRINNKLILKSDTDLRDLQIQYRTALQHQDQQHALLSELKEKLRQASVFYQKLNLQNLVIDSDLLEQNDSSGDDSDSNQGHEY